jgi:hypothetical protein
VNVKPSRFAPVGLSGSLPRASGQRAADERHAARPELVGSCTCFVRAVFEPACVSARLDSVASVTMVRDSYLWAIGRELRRHAVWEAGTPMAPGDYGKFQGGDTLQISASQPTP